MAVQTGNLNVCVAEIIVYDFWSQDIDDKGDKP